MPYRSPLRWLAPIALAAALFATYSVAKPGSDDGDDTPTVVQDDTETTPRPKTKRTVYVVKRGDVLSAIAESTGIDVERLQALNPGLDADTLRPGQRLKLTTKAQ